MWLIWLGAWACGSSGDFWSCGDASCRSQQVEAAWQQAPDRVATLLDSLDPSEQLALTMQLAEDHPGDTRALCEALSPGPAQDRCWRINDRPHLRDQAPRHAPRSRELEPGWTARLDPAACASTPDPGTCLSKRACTEAGAGQPEQAWAACQLRTEGRFRDECIFEAAECALEENGGAAYRDAIALCGQAGDYLVRCHAHALSRVVRVVPRADAIDPARVAEALEGAERIEAAWTPLGPDVVALYVDQFWALWTEVAFSGSRVVSGALLGLLPPIAAPHVRAAAAARLQARGRLTGGLADREATLAEALDQPGGPPAAGQPFPLIQILDLRADPPPGQTVHYRGPPRRHLATDPAEDAAVCILHAAAAGRDPDRALLTAAQTDPRPTVAQSARELLATLPPAN